MSLLDFFDKALKYCQEHHFQEMEYVERRRFDQQTTQTFFQEYVWVVLNSGLKYAVAKKLFEKYFASHDLSVIGHLGKREAIRKAALNYQDWFRKLLSVEDKLEFLDSLPFIGGITRYHLARNLGIDCAKPDRHLSRLARRFGFDDVQEMCQAISQKRHLRIGTVDVILWRYSIEHVAIEEK